MERRGVRGPRWDSHFASKQVGDSIVLFPLLKSIYLLVLDMPLGTLADKKKRKGQKESEKASSVKRFPTLCLVFFSFFLSWKSSPLPLEGVPVILANACIGPGKPTDHAFAYVYKPSSKSWPKHYSGATTPYSVQICYFLLLLRSLCGHLCVFFVCRVSSMYGWPFWGLNFACYGRNEMS